MEFSIFFALPSLSVLVISFWLVVNTNKRELLLDNPPLFIFLLGIIGLNLIEFLTYSRALEPSVLMMKLYYIFIIFTLASMLILTLRISNLKAANNIIGLLQNVVSITAIFFTFVIISSDFVISGIEYTDYSVTRIPGKFYFLMKYLFIGFSLPILALLFIGSTRKSIDNNVKRSRVILFSFSPLLISLLVVFFFMEIGIKINASFVLPIGSAFLFLAIIKTEKSDDLFNLLVRIPYTSENISYNKITDEIKEFLSSTRCGSQVSLKTLTTSLEQHIVNMAVELSNGSQVKAAELLNTSTSSICRKKRV